MDFQPYLFFFLSGLTACLFLTPLFIRIAPRLGLLDHPAHRKTHAQAIPKSGGLALVASVLLASALSIKLFGRSMGYDEISTIKSAFVLGITFAAAAIGLMDDLFEMRPLQKLLLQALVIGAFAFLGFRFEILHLPGLKPFGLSFLDVSLTIFWMLAVLNGFNFMDGIDGLAGSVTAVILLGIGVAEALSTGHGPGGIWLTTLGATAAFLFYNRQPAKIFLGDTGSIALGTFITATLVALGSPRPGFLDFRLFSHNAQAEPIRYQILTVTLLVGYPALEAALSTFRRAFKRYSMGRSMGSAEREHIHHVLLKAGWPVNRICLAAAAIQLALSGAGLLVMAHKNGLVLWLLVPLFILAAFFGPKFGFFNFLQMSSRQRPNFRVANYFISMQKVKLELANSREDVLVLVSQTSQEFGVKSCRLIIKPDENGLGGTDYFHEWDTRKPSEFLGFIHGEGPAKSFSDHYKLSGGRGGAHWVFEPQAQEEDLDVEYHVLVSDFMRQALETALRIGTDQATLEMPAADPLAHEAVSSHILRRAPSRAQENP